MVVIQMRTEQTKKEQSLKTVVPGLEYASICFSLSPHTSTIRSQELSTFGKVCNCQGTLSSHIYTSIKEREGTPIPQMSFLCQNAEADCMGVNINSSWAWGVWYELMRSLEWGFSHALWGLQNSTPVPLCSLRVVMPGSPSLFAACPQSLTPFRSPTNCSWMPGAIWDHLWSQHGDLASSKVHILSQPPEYAFTILLSLHTSSLACMGPVYGRQHLPAVLHPAHHSPTAAASSPRRDGMVQNISSRSAEESKAVKTRSQCDCSFSTKAISFLSPFFFFPL